MPHLSVSTVIPTYNRAPVLERALRSVLPECQPGDEVIVVDDGSTDETESLVRAFGAPIRYLRTAHRGAGAARNAGIRVASGDLVAFLDSDDEWIPGKLSWQRAILARYPEILFVFSDFVSIGRRGEHVRRNLRNWSRDPRPWDAILGPGVPSREIPGMPGSAPAFLLHVGSLYRTFLRHWSVCTITLVVRRQMAGDALRFAEDLPTYEDLECFCRLTGRGSAGYMDCETAYNHNDGRGPRLTDADALTRAVARVKIYERVWGSDPAFLERYREEFEDAMDHQRDRLVRRLLARGRTRDARREVARLFHPRLNVRVLSRLPGAVARTLLAARSRALSLRRGRER